MYPLNWCVNLIYGQPAVLNTLRSENQGGRGRGESPRLDPNNETAPPPPSSSAIPSPVQVSLSSPEHVLILSRALSCVASSCPTSVAVIGQPATRSSVLPHLRAASVRSDNMQLPSCVVRQRVHSFYARNPSFSPFFFASLITPCTCLLSTPNCLQKSLMTAQGGGRGWRASKESANQRATLTHQRRYKHMAEDHQSRDSNTKQAYEGGVTELALGGMEGACEGGSAEHRSIMC